MNIFECVSEERLEDLVWLADDAPALIHLEDSNDLASCVVELKVARATIETLRGALIRIHMHSTDIHADAGALLREITMECGAIFALQPAIPAPIEKPTGGADVIRSFHDLPVLWPDDELP